jgi:NAD(P)H-dependent FMN reductase
MAIRVLAVTGSYRSGGTVEAAVAAVLEGARAAGAETSTIRLLDQHIEFCTNCRACTQAAGERRGACPQKDDMDAILGRIEAADALVLAAPVNFYNVTALFRRFLERLVCHAYWPWGAHGPVFRSKVLGKRAVLVTASAAPGFLLPFFTGAPRALKVAAKVLGARPIGRLWLGLSAQAPAQALAPRTLARAQALGRDLVPLDSGEGSVRSRHKQP